jgi:hypothetical protein
MKNAAIPNASLFFGKTPRCFGCATKAGRELSAASGLAQAARLEGRKARYSAAAPGFLLVAVFYEARAGMPLSGSKCRKFAP